MNKYRTHNCSELTDKETGKTVLLSGWLHRKRDHGNLLFLDLRDHFGLTQCVIENNNWQMYGSRKPNCDRYEITHIYELDEGSLNKIDKSTETLLFYQS